MIQNLGGQSTKIISTNSKIIQTSTASSYTNEHLNENWQYQIMGRKVEEGIFKAQIRFRHTSNKTCGLNTARALNGSLDGTVDAEVARIPLDAANLWLLFSGI